LVGFVFVDITTSDIDGYVRKASQQLSQRIQYPPGYYISWAGQFQYLQAAKERLKIVIPLTLLIIFVLLYMNTKSLVKTGIVLLAVPFSLIGAFWLLYILGYNMSVAVWVGLIALAGLDAETGVVMLLYLDHAWEKFKAEGRMTSMRDLHDAVIEGAVGRVRPKIMTVCAILFGLLPIMWSPAMQAGADVMKRIATPMIGGVVTSGILELLIYPVIYAIWRRRELPDRTKEKPGPIVPPALVPSHRVRHHLPGIIATILIAIGLIYGANFVWHKASPRKITSPPFATQTVNELTIKLMAPAGQLIKGDNNVLIEFRDSDGQLVDVGDVNFTIDMNMPGMALHGGGPVQKNEITGQYRTKVKADMSGDWNAKISFQGPHGEGQTNFAVNIAQ
jgi:AcrB/AcrD/AcrF family protein/YtkA-like protein